MNYYNCNNSFNIEINKPSNLYIYSIDGTLVNSELIKIGVNNIDVSYLQKGLYFVMINANIRKLIIR